MRTIDEIDGCMTAAGFPEPSLVFGAASIGSMISISNNILKAAKAAGTELTFGELAAIMAAEAGAGAAAEVVAQAAIVAGTVVASVYIGACITCALTCLGKSALLAELEDAEGGDAYELAWAEAAAAPSDEAVA